MKKRQYNQHRQAVDGGQRQRGQGIEPGVVDPDFGTWDTTNLLRARSERLPTASGCRSLTPLQAQSRKAARQQPNMSSSDTDKSRRNQKIILHTFAYQRVLFIQHAYYQQFE
jgi:hypothetical protein